MNKLSREELLEKICPTDATNDCCQGNRSYSCDKCDELLNYLLDRYDAKVRATAIEEFISEIDLDKPMHFTKEQAAWIKKYVILKRHDAIKEFVKSIEKNQTMQDNYLDAPRFEMSVDMTDILKIAEQLKEG